MSRGEHEPREVALEVTEMPSSSFGVSEGSTWHVTSSQVYALSQNKWILLIALMF